MKPETRKFVYGVILTSIIFSTVLVVYIQSGKTDNTIKMEVEKVSITPTPKITPSSTPVVSTSSNKITINEFLDYADRYYFWEDAPLDISMNLQDGSGLEASVGKNTIKFDHALGIGGYISYYFNYNLPYPSSTFDQKMYADDYEDYKGGFLKNSKYTNPITKEPYVDGEWIRLETNYIIILTRRCKVDALEEWCNPNVEKYVNTYNKKNALKLSGIFYNLKNFSFLIPQNYGKYVTGISTRGSSNYVYMEMYNVPSVGKLVLKGFVDKNFKPSVYSFKSNYLVDEYEDTINGIKLNVYSYKKEGVYNVYTYFMVKDVWIEAIIPLTNLPSREELTNMISPYVNEISK